ncbi:S9 family peptidase [Dinghuibacter silviterrae]|uniref:Dipeptidyl aminopeptidase/acylaminoacyl peptidase n=1 Tax=Dinghuibacter silviterrae TaxID=1539049 RepID=A0A4R8DPP8_9BACT|nr:prolyl oligopeptidase family serine peptidase [Dinghuibacter silviterrae]TDW99697.1 dipeptidyl aminopeptidase/acylaminoacyl peptidase [Dinghuibacter silviterrae]
MGKIVLLCLGLFTFVAARAQELTVQKIMRDPKWIGTSPSGVFWSPDGKQVLFDWNPDGAASDSLFGIALPARVPVKIPFLQAGLLQAQSEGSYNVARTELVYSYEGDIFLMDIKDGRIHRLTHTAEAEFAPAFAHHDGWIVYRSGENLFAWDRVAGELLQLTNFAHGGEVAPAARGPRRGTGGAAVAGDPQEQWLIREQLEWMQVVKERHDKREARDAYLKAEKNPDTLKVINTGEKTVRGQTLSPDGRFVTYSLYEAPTPAGKATIVPNYVTESGFTTDIPGRTKVGEPQGRYTFFVYDRERDTVMEVKADSLPGFTDEPEYLKDYAPRHLHRSVIFEGPYWNESGTQAIIDIRTQDFKDRWIVALDPAHGTIQSLDHQRDEAWIGGPGIGWLARASVGWIDDHTCWYHSEATGYSHLYAFDLHSHTAKALTSGNYEVQRAVLSNDKKYFFIQTNEEHPGKQNWYRLAVTGGSAEKITGMTGEYEVTLSPDQHWIAYLYSYINKPWELYLQENAPGKSPVKITCKSMSTEFSAYPWRDTRIFTIPARDGKNIYARIYDPAPGKKNGAAVIFVHGAGYLQNVHYGWSSYFREYMFNNLLADKGYTVLDIDYRASSGYGRDWRTGIYRHMGGKDLDDEVDAAHYLVRELGVDSTRIGMYGGSYGGFMTLMALFTKPGVFKAGAALRPVTDWAHYNHGYTAAILNEPYTDSIAYRRSSPIFFASGFQDHLLLCHGMVDENVHFQDDVRLVQRLIELGKDNWELAVFPMEDHGFVEPSSWTDEYKRILKLFDTNLCPPRP